MEVSLIFLSVQYGISHPFITKRFLNVLLYSHEKSSYHVRHYFSPSIVLHFSVVLLQEKHHFQIEYFFCLQHIVPLSSPFLDFFFFLWFFIWDTASCQDEFGDTVAKNEGQSGKSIGRHTKILWTLFWPFLFYIFRLITGIWSQTWVVSSAPCTALGTEWIVS